MKDWFNLEPDRYRLMNKHYTPGRNGRRIDKVVIHHNAGVLSIDQIWQVWQDRQASAHYQVESGGRIGQLVNDWDTAWHAANTFINETSIGIEVSNSGYAAQDWPITSTAVEEAAHLTAALHHGYNLGRPRSGVTVRYHREFTGTSCPHHLAPGGKYHAKFWERVLYWYDAMTKTAPAPKPEPAPTKPKETPVNQDQANRIEHKLDLLLDQIAGRRNDQGVQEFNGWPQGGQRTMYDLVAASAAALEVPNTSDTKEGRK